MVRVVGLGTQDDLGLAREFVANRGTTFTMLWDPSFESWRAVGILGQPAAVLLSPGGQEVERWLGAFDEDEVVRLASAL